MLDPSVKVSAINLTTGEFLFGKEANISAAPASLTKMMTLLVAAKAMADKNVVNFNLNSQIPITDIAIRRASGLASNSSIQNGTTLPMQEILWRTGSRSDAKTTIALAIATANAVGIEGSEEQKYAWFVRQMNHTAKSLGMNDTTFVNVTGDNGNISTANDISKLIATFHQRYPKTSSIAMDGRHGHSSRSIGSNKTVRKAKTGYLRAAGYNEALIMQANNGDMVAISMFGADSKVHRHGRMNAYVDWVNNPHLIPATFISNNGGRELTNSEAFAAANLTTNSPAQIITAVEQSLRPVERPANLITDRFAVANANEIPSSAVETSLRPIARPTTTYVTQPGDSPWKIAGHFGVSAKNKPKWTETFIKANNIKNARRVPANSKVVIPTLAA